MSRLPFIKNINNIFGAAWTAVAVLLICVMLTLSLLGTAMGLFARASEPDVIINIMPPASRDLISAHENSASYATYLTRAVAIGVDTQRKAASSIVPMSMLSETFYLSDDKQIWGSDTQIDIFRAFYENGEGVVTVASKKGDKVIAPGTSNTYVFYLTNAGAMAIDYDMILNASVTDSGDGLVVPPIMVRLYDEDGTWLCGSAEEFVPYFSLDGASKSAVLGAGSYSTYTLEWQWPFDGNDEFDTFIGNLGDDDAIALTFGIEIAAEYDSDPDTSGGILPPTGDDSTIIMWIFLMLLSIIALIAILTLRHRMLRSERDV